MMILKLLADLSLLLFRHKTYFPKLASTLNEVALVLMRIQSNTIL